MTASATPGSRLKTLGSFGLWIDDTQIPEPSTKKARAVLVSLVSNAPAPVAREKLLELLWPEAEPERARASLSTAVWSIRKLLRTAGFDGNAIIASNNTALTWTLPAEVDALVFRAQARRGDDAARAAAIALYAGDFLDDDYDDWAIAERERLAAEYERLLSASVTASSDTELAQRLLERDPYNEDAYVALIEAQLKANRPFAALGLVERYHRALRDLGGAPSDTFTSRYAQIETLVRPGKREFALPLMGRDVEFDMLCECVSRVQRGEGRLILLHGDPGIGKSTLLQLLSKVSGSSVPTYTIAAIDGDARPYGSWERFFTERTGENFADVAKSTRQVADAIAVRLNDALTEPCVLIVDDAQYFRAEAFAILTAFAALAHRKHCVVIASRPERTAEIRTALHAAPMLDIPLPLISEDDFTAGILEATNEAETAFIGAMYRRSQGHPLFFTEICKALLLNGSLVMQEGVWRYTGSATSLGGIPETLRATIHARLRARGEHAALAAAILAADPEASLRDITAVAEFTEDRAVDSLEELLSARIIEESNAGPHYRFTHDLVGEVAAELLSQPRREALARRLVTHLRESDAPHAQARRARHLAACGEHREAARSFLAAAAESADLHAWRQAVAHCESALEHAVALPRSTARSHLAAEIYIAMSQAQCDGIARALAAASATRAIADAKAGDDPTLLATAYIKRASANAASGEIERVLPDVAAAAELIDRDAQPEFYLRTNELRLAVLFETGRFDEAVQLADDCFATALRHDQIVSANRALHYAVTIGATRWHFAEAVEAAARSGPLAQRCGSSVQGSDAFAVARLAYLLDDCEVARRLVDRGFECLAVLQVSSDPPHLSEMSPPLLSFYLRYMRAVIANRAGDYETAIASAEEAWRETDGKGSVLHLVITDGLLGRAAKGDLAAAADRLAALPAGYVPNALGFSDTRASCEARLETARGSPKAPALVAAALGEVAIRAESLPLTSDAVFAQLRACAETLNDANLATRAAELETRYIARRRAAAAHLWRNAASLLATTST